MRRILATRRAMTLSAGEPTTTLNNSLYAWYDMEESSGTRVDQLGNWDLDTETGTPTSETGKIGSALELTATENVYSSTKSTGLGFDGDGDFSISMWVKFDSAGVFETYVSHWGANGSKSWFFSKDASNLVRVDTSSNGTGITTTTTHGAITATNWNHLAFCYDDTAGSVQVYVNGTASGTSHSESLSTVADYYVIWGTLSTNSNPMTGNIDLVGVWNKCLNQGEVTELYNNGDGKAYPF